MRTRSAQAHTEMPSLPLMCRKKNVLREIFSMGLSLWQALPSPTLYTLCIRDDFLLGWRAQGMLRVQVCTYSLQTLRGSSSSCQGLSCSPGLLCHAGRFGSSRAKGVMDQQRTAVIARSLSGRKQGSRSRTG